MTDSGLSTRLRQQSRRAGLMVGITMVLAIVILIFGAAGLFAWLSQPFSDLIPISAPAANVPAPSDSVDGGGGVVPTAAPQVAAQVEATEVPAIEPTRSADSFEPSHQIASGSSINFRTGPSVSDGIIGALPPGAPLQFLDEDANSADGVRWMRFRNENGDEGWVREIDTGTYQP